MDNLSPRFLKMVREYSSLENAFDTDYSVSVRYIANIEVDRLVSSGGTTAEAKAAVNGALKAFVKRFPVTLE